MLKRYQEWMYRWERRLTTRDTNRVARHSNGVWSGAGAGREFTAKRPPLPKTPSVLL